MRLPCVQLPAVPPPERITLPGGVVLEQHELLRVIQPALAPIVPMLQLVDALLATFRCLEAIPAALGPPPDPSILSSRLRELAKKADHLLHLVPQLSLPLTVAGVVNLLLGTLSTAQRQLAALQRQSQRVEEVATRAESLEDIALLDVAACARGNLAQEVENVAGGLAALGKLVALLNLLGGFIGAPRVPDLSSAAGLPLLELLSLVTELKDTLTTVRAALPRG